MINVSIEAYHADRMLGFDFLLENSGGSVMLDHCSPTYTHSIATVSLFGVPLWHISSSPKVIIQVPVKNITNLFIFEIQNASFVVVVVVFVVVLF